MTAGKLFVCTKVFVYIFIQTKDCYRKQKGKTEDHFFFKIKINIITNSIFAH